MIGSAHDPAERAADHLADRALRRQIRPSLAPAFSAGAKLRRACADCEAEQQDPHGKDSNVRREATASAGGARLSASSGPAGGRASPAAQASLTAMGSGRPLNGGERNFFEPRFNADFSGVRIHEDQAADRAAEHVGARAFTLGQDIAFADGERQAGGPALMAHELAHTLQEPGALRRQDKKEKTYKDIWDDTDFCNASRPLIEKKLAKIQSTNKDKQYRIVEGEYLGDFCWKIQVKKRLYIPQPGESCSQYTDSKSLIKSHIVSPTSIKRPGDEVTIKLRFQCNPRSFKSVIVDDKTDAIVDGPHDVKAENKKLPQFVYNQNSSWTYNWDGMKFYPDVRRFMYGDGVFRHELRDFAYTEGSPGDLMVNGGNVASTGDKKIHVASKNEIDCNPIKGGPSNHLYDEKGAEITQNVIDLADAMFAEARGESETEQRAVGWAIRNTMARGNKGTVAGARAINRFASKASPPEFKTLAREILGAPMSKDTTQGAIKWYSPQAMPKNKEQCDEWWKHGFEEKPECDGGLVALESDKSKTSMAPGWVHDMTYIPLKGVTEWAFRFFKL